MSFWSFLRNAFIFGAIYDWLFGKNDPLFNPDADKHTRRYSPTRDYYIRSDKSIYDYDSVDDLEAELYELEDQLDSCPEDSERYDLLQDRIEMLQDRIDELEDLDCSYHPDNIGFGNRHSGYDYMDDHDFDDFDDDDW